MDVCVWYIQITSFEFNNTTIILMKVRQLERTRLIIISIQEEREEEWRGRMTEDLHMGSFKSAFHANLQPPLTLLCL